MTATLERWKYHEGPDALMVERDPDGSVTIEVSAEDPGFQQQIALPPEKIRELIDWLCDPKTNPQGDLT